MCAYSDLYKSSLDFDEVAYRPRLIVHAAAKFFNVEVLYLFENLAKSKEYECSINVFALISTPTWII